MLIRIHIMIFSDVRGSLERGVVRPMVAARHRRTNLTRPASIQDNGGVKLRELLHLATSSMNTSAQGKK
jgi:hypothetical protein